MDRQTLAVVLGLGAVGVLALYVARKGVAGAASGAGAAVVDAADGAASGIVGGIGSRLGLPAPSQTISDPAVVRWIADRYGWLTASRWGTAGAYLRALALPASAGKPPALPLDVAAVSGSP